jgi:hypothetical protein
VLRALETVLGVTSRKRDLAMIFNLPRRPTVRMQFLLGTVRGPVNGPPVMA